LIQTDKIDIIFDVLTSFFYKKQTNVYQKEGIVFYDSEEQKLIITLENIYGVNNSDLDEFEGEANKLFDVNECALRVQQNGKDSFYTLKKYPFTNTSEIKSIFVSPAYSNYRELGRYWDKYIYLTDKEQDVINALKIIEPNIEKIGFKGDSTSRSVEIKLKGDNQLHSINDMGDGMNRILSIIISLINAENGTLLIDEFENGLHYTAQYQLWEMIFTLSLKLNVQVFVSTHSSDCIKAFENTLNNGFSENGKVLRLENKKGNITIQEFDSKEMEIVTQNDVEIR
jgi:AAA15 family ATPase/GTPase